MSVSKRLAVAFQVYRAGIGSLPTARDTSQLNGFQPKRPEIVCRKCDGFGVLVTDDVSGKCPRCGGKGTEKLSIKAIRKLQATLPKLDPGTELVNKFMGGYRGK